MTEGPDLQLLGFLSPLTAGVLVGVTHSRFLIFKEAGAITLPTVTGARLLLLPLPVIPCILISEA